MDRIKRLIGRLLLIYHTVIHLKPIQVYYQITYRLRSVFRKVVGFHYPQFIASSYSLLSLYPWIDKPRSYDEGVITFLNQSLKTPSYRIETYSPLWRYNFNYMDFLLQPELDEETGLALIEKFVDEFPQNKIGADPYPIALRGINWIKFFIKYSIDSKKLSDSLYAQYHILYDKIEYHLLANHLLEDGFSLLFGAFYFKEQKFYRKAKEIIQTELNEQVLSDGAHFELSPMYHQIILDRLLDCINLLKSNQRFDGQDELLDLMILKAQKMLGWLNVITFANGEIPLLNDASIGIAPSTTQLKEYAKRLSITTDNSIPFSSSGYRKFTSPTYECIVDVGQIGPNYQPGHAHADSFNFVLNINNEPFIVDTGISTYNTGETRFFERGTSSHNTVSILNKNSSEVWSSFRVGRRANVEILNENNTSVVARHDGYRRFSTIHQREWFFSENHIEISDTLSGKIKEGKAHLWLAPDLVPTQNESDILVNGNIISFNSAENVELIPTKIPTGYNMVTNSYMIEITFTGRLKTTIKLNENTFSN